MKMSLETCNVIPASAMLIWELHLIKFPRNYIVLKLFILNCYHLMKLQLKSLFYGIEIVNHFENFLGWNMFCGV